MAFAVALGCVLALVPLIRRMCARWGIFDQPGHLKIHREPIPRLGGMGIAFGLVAGVVSAVHGAGAGALFFVAAFGLVWLAGFVDDLRELPPGFRLLAQIGGALLLYAGGLARHVFIFRCFRDCGAVFVRDSVCECVQFFGRRGRVGGGNYGGDRAGVRGAAGSAAERLWPCGGVEFAGGVCGVFIF